MKLRNVIKYIISFIIGGTCYCILDILYKWNYPRMDIFFLGGFAGICIFTISNFMDYLEHKNK